MRGALVYAGLADPVLTRAELQAKGGTEMAAARDFAPALAAMTSFGKRPLTAANLILVMKEDGLYGGLSGLQILAILEAVIGEVTARTLGNWLGRLERRRFGDLVIQRSDGRGRGSGFTWAAVRAAE